MADDCDRADEMILLDLERAIAAARSPMREPATRCRYCDEPLEVHRREYGTCIECQQRAERTR